MSLAPVPSDGDGDGVEEASVPLRAEGECVPESVPDSTRLEKNTFDGNGDRVPASSVVVGAPTGVAAFNASGATNHHIWKINKSNENETVVNESIKEVLEGVPTRSFINIVMRDLL